MGAPSTFSREHSSWSWPADVPPLRHPDHERLLKRWCLDQLPGEVRQYAVFQRHLPALLLVTDNYIHGSLSGLRTAYSVARSELAEYLPPEAIAASMHGMKDVGENLRLAADFVALMRELHTTE